MADFVSVLRRAVGSLENNTDAARQAIYAKAHAALRAQLEAIDPPLGPDEITRQIESLDGAIAVLEAEFSPPQRPHEAFQSAVSESGSLGTAASTAAREARKTLDRIDGEDENDDLGGGPPSEAHVERREPSLAPPPAEPPAEAPSPKAPPAPPPGVAPPAQAKRPAAAGPAPLAGSSVTPAATRPVPPADIYDEDEGPERGGSGRLVAWGILALVLLGIAGVGLWQREALMDAVGSLTGSGQQAGTDDGGKIADRLPGSGEPAPAPSEPAPAPGEPSAVPAPAPLEPPSATAEGERIAQALLLEESVSGVSPANTLGGSVDWQLVDDTEAVGGVDKVIRGTVTVPERDLALTLTIRRNKDQALPASHLIELVFQPGPGFGHGGIASIPGLLMKATPRSSGQPLVGAVVPVMDDFFLIGLSESEIDRERNVQEMTSRDFIDIPVGYKDGGRAVLSLAKGESGQRVFEEAFAAWDGQ